MNWRRSLIGVAVAMPIIALLAYGMTRDPNMLPSPLPGRAAPEFALPIMDQEPDSARLTDHRGDVVVVNFWASWCLECRHEHSDLSTAAVEYAPHGVSFYGIVYNDSPNNARAWIREMGGQAYPSLLDQGSRTAIGYGLYGVPETFVIDRDGVVVHKQIGAITKAQLDAVIRPLLADRDGAGADAPAGVVSPEEVR